MVGEIERITEKKPAIFIGDMTETKVSIDNAHGEYGPHVDVTTYIPGVTEVDKRRIDQNQRPGY